MANQANMGKGVIDRVNLPAVAWADASDTMRYTMQPPRAPLHGKESP